MEQAIKNFAEQFAFEPKIENADTLKKTNKFVVIGMGGSHLSADILKVWRPSLDLVIHSNYGLPALEKEELQSRLIILNSYSGNTEEVLDAFEAVLKNGLAMAVVSIGGKLLELAKKHGVPYIQMPDTGIQPRMSLGFNSKSLLKLMGEEGAVKELGDLAKILKPLDYESMGRELAAKLKNKIPVIYGSARDIGIAYNWKAKLNETGKTPAFFNIFPELNHNEMTGFDIAPATKQLSEKFHFVFLRDHMDNVKILKRMDIAKKLYEDRGLKVEFVELNGATVWHKIFGSLILADWTAYYLAASYGVESEQVPLVEEFKRLMAL